MAKVNCQYVAVANPTEAGAGDYKLTIDECPGCQRWQAPHSDRCDCQPGTGV